MQALLAAQRARKGALTAAICAAPVVALARHGALDGWQATCHPAFQSELEERGVFVAERRVVESANDAGSTLVSSRGAGSAEEWALALVAKLFDDEKAKEIAAGLVAR